MLTYSIVLLPLEGFAQTYNNYPHTQNMCRQADCNVVVGSKISSLVQGVGGW